MIYCEFLLEFIAKNERIKHFLKQPKKHPALFWYYSGLFWRIPKDQKKNSERIQAQWGTTAGCAVIFNSCHLILLLDLTQELHCVHSVNCVLCDNKVSIIWNYHTILVSNKWRSLVQEVSFLVRSDTTHPVHCSSFYQAVFSFCKIGLSLFQSRGIIAADDSTTKRNQVSLVGSQWHEWSVACLAASGSS